MNVELLNVDLSNIDLLHVDLMNVDWQYFGNWNFDQAGFLSV